MYIYIYINTPRLWLQPGARCLSPQLQVDLQTKLTIVIIFGYNLLINFTLW